MEEIQWNAAKSTTNCWECRGCNAGTRPLGQKLRWRNNVEDELFFFFVSFFFFYFMFPAFPCVLFSKKKTTTTKFPRPRLPPAGRTAVSHRLRFRDFWLVPSILFLFFFLGILRPFLFFVFPFWFRRCSSFRRFICVIVGLRGGSSFLVFLFFFFFFGLPFFCVFFYCAVDRSKVRHLGRCRLATRCQLPGQSSGS